MSEARVRLQLELPARMSVPGDKWDTLTSRWPRRAPEGDEYECGPCRHRPIPPQPTTLTQRKQV
ncbi:hypothetical protein E2C01_061561 [Portunus trituberculatus]|uniref:Uncharacterized protein n=1 Tax=Portunus trituberculatus TaxID=210409 RepID=A0A5B7HBL3_PORTR|nr:hypothetical protein [Portunus trituberculatus]